MHISRAELQLSFYRKILIYTEQRFSPSVIFRRSNVLFLVPKNLILSFAFILALPRFRAVALSSLRKEAASFLEFAPGKPFMIIPSISNTALDCNNLQILSGISG